MYCWPYQFKWNSLHNFKLRKFIIQENTRVCSNTQEYQISEYVLKHCLFLHLNKRHSWKWSEKNWYISKGLQCCFSLFSCNMCHLWGFYIYKRVHAGIQGAPAHMDGINAYGEKNLFENEFYNFFVVRFHFFSLCIFKRVCTLRHSGCSHGWC